MNCTVRRWLLPSLLAAVVAVGVAALAAPASPWVATGFPVAQASFAKLPAAGS